MKLGTIWLRCSTIPIDLEASSFSLLFVLVLSTSPLPFPYSLTLFEACALVPATPSPHHLWPL